MTICDRTGLTKPECHCATCMAAMIAAHAPALSAPAPIQGAASRGPVKKLHVVNSRAA
jgi:hypothetical protein